MNRFCIALAAMSLAATEASAAAVVDVDNLLVRAAPIGGMTGVGASSNDTPTFSSTLSLEQTWTVGKTGRLAQVDLFGDASALYTPTGVTSPLDFDVTLTILGGGAASTPGDVVLAAVTKSAADLADFGVSSFDFHALNIYAIAGTVLTWRMSVEACPDLPYCARSWRNWNNFTVAGGGNTYGYASGQAFQTIDGVTYGAGDQDMNFRTWVSVPEPATWGLMILGFLSAGAEIRRRRLTA